MRYLVILAWIAGLAAAGISEAEAWQLESILQARQFDLPYHPRSFELRRRNHLEATSRSQRWSDLWRRSGSESSGGTPRLSSPGRSPGSIRPPENTFRVAALGVPSSHSSPPRSPRRPTTPTTPRSPSQSTNPGSPSRPTSPASQDGSRGRPAKVDITAKWPANLHTVTGNGPKALYHANDVEDTMRLRDHHPQYAIAGGQSTAVLPWGKKIVASGQGQRVVAQVLPSLGSSGKIKVEHENGEMTNIPITKGEGRYYTATKHQSEDQVKMTASSKSGGQVQVIAMNDSSPGPGRQRFTNRSI